jgi:hypothetical protein
MKRAFALGKNSKTLVKFFYMPFFYVSRVTNLTTPRSAPDDKQIANSNYNSNIVVKRDFAVVMQIDGRAAHMTDTTRNQSNPLPYQIMVDPSQFCNKTNLQHGYIMPLTQ